MDEPEELAALIAQLNTQADPAHADWTAGMHGLIAQGLAVLPGLLPLLDHEQSLIRLRAQRVLERVSHDWLATQIVEQPLRRRVARASALLWTRNGAYDWQAESQHRQAAMARWQDWLAAPAVPASSPP
ncbi:hypothetical protein VVD49_06455 [Uliginosibacterium sp. H3]|uniref:HEAT repeat domain-containing protein n=1 Tax=Uliginosibacterium silvisoli TaxID=3114758 RepID=A0ABU6K1Q4_9RHOO|nr:hypothetical protein [Uliginosibacterium sp. H3]